MILIHIVLAIGQDKIQMKGMENTLSYLWKNLKRQMTLHSRLMKLVDRASGKIAVGFVEIQKIAQL